MLYICKMVVGVMGRAHFGRKPHWSEKALWAFFAGFPKFVPSERQESFGSPAFFHVKWALLRLSLIFVPFLAQSRDAKTEKKGEKGNKNLDSLRKRPICPFAATNSFGICHMKGNKILEIAKKRPAATRKLVGRCRSIPSIPQHPVHSTVFRSTFRQCLTP